jgi:uncharacterized protein YodC (DUF2158 family)
MLEKIENDKVFFNPGDVVKIKHPLDYVPAMLVKEKATKMIKGDSHFQGIKCFWYTTTGEYQEQVFSTKDLSMIKGAYQPSSDFIKAPIKTH